jgi:hypothetical protein
MHRRGRRERRGGEKRECFRSVGCEIAAELISHSEPLAREQDISRFVLARANTTVKAIIGMLPLPLS